MMYFKLNNNFIDILLVTYLFFFFFFVNDSSFYSINICKKIFKTCNFVYYLKYIGSNKLL